MTSSVRRVCVCGESMTSSGRWVCGESMTSSGRRVCVERA